jgi:lantibiotic transport system permease protein
MEAVFFNNTKAEFLKTKRTAAFWLTVVAATFIPVVNFIRLIAKPAVFIPRMHKDPWNIIIDDNWKVSTLFLLPMFVILVTSLIVQVEYRNNTWKQVYASPRSYADIFFSRFLVIHCMILFCFLMFNVSILLASSVTNLIQPGYEFFSHPVPWSSLFQVTGKVYISVFAITSIQYWLSLRLKNFIVPMGIGLALVITGIIIHQWDQLYFYPYMYPGIAYWKEFSQVPGVTEKAQFYNATWFIAILLLAFWDSSKRKEKG